MTAKNPWTNFRLTFGAFLPFFVAGVATAADRKSTPALAPSEIVAAAPASDWVAIEATDLLVMDLASGPERKERRVVIQLMPPPFSQGWVGNIRKLAAARWWDGTSVNRVQDNYVVQWGDANGEDKATAKALPPGLVLVPQRQYGVSSDLGTSDVSMAALKALVAVQRAVRTAQEAAGEPAPSNVDAFPIERYAKFNGIWDGWPFTADDSESVWPVHCYGMVGVGRGMPPDTGTGAELYTVIGHAPRHLDRNIALVGRVVSGIENLSSLPRGTGPLGFYEKPEERTAITSIRIGSDVKDLPRFEYLSTESVTFATYADARANRRDPFFIMPAGGADICNIPVPVRVVPGEPARK